MFARRDQFKSSYGAYTSQQRELERNRASRDERDAAEAAADADVTESAEETPAAPSDDATSDVPPAAPTPA
jgi:hypothetical protein